MTGAGQVRSAPDITPPSYVGGNRPEAVDPSSQVPPATMLNPLRHKGFSRLTPGRACC
jgi:hypothetical protein